MRPVSNRLRRTAILAVAGTTALATLSACTAPWASTTAAAQPVTATTPVRVTTIVRSTPAVAPPTSKAPALITTGAAWPTVLPSLITYGQWLSANPNPALAATITTPGCGSFNALTSELQSLVDQNAYIQPSAPILTSIAGPNPGGTSAAAAVSLGGQVTVDIQVVRGAEPIISRPVSSPAKAATPPPISATRVLFSHAQLPPTSLRITLIRGADGKWHFCTISDTFNGQNGDAITALL